MNEMITGRLERLRRQMKEKGIDYYLIPTSDFHNSEYVHAYFKVREHFSGFTGSNGTLVISKEEAGLWTDGRYFIQAEQELEGTGITLYRMGEEGVPDIAGYLSSAMKEGQVLGFDGRTVSAAFGLRLKKKLQPMEITFHYDEDVAGDLWEDRCQLPASKLMLLSSELCGADVEEKIAAVREKMKEASAQSLLIGRLDDLMWLLNIRGKDVDCNPVALSYGFLTLTECFFFVQKEALTKEARDYAEKVQIQLKDYSEILPFLEKEKIAQPVMLDRNHISYILYEAAGKRGEIVDIQNPTELLKARKNETELERMREIYKKDSAAVCRFLYWVKKNAGSIPMDEVTAAGQIDGYRREIEEYLDLSFPTICGYGPNAAMMHYSATPEKKSEIRPEGMLLVDSGGQYFGGTTDVTRTIVLGEITEEEKKFFTRVAMGMLRLAGARFLHGCTGRNLDILARQPLWDCATDYKCGTGHGIGYMLNVHEGPHGIRWKYNPGDKETVLESGMVVSNEPGVYKEGSFGIRTENILVVREDVKNEDGQFLCFEHLTYVPVDRDGLDLKEMQPGDIKLLNEYHREVYKRISGYLDEETREWLKEVTAPLQADPNL